MNVLRALLRGEGWRLRTPHRSLPIVDLYPTATFPDWIRTWPDGTQEVLLRDGTTRRVSARNLDGGYANHPDFEATGVGRYSPRFPFDGKAEA